MLKRTCLHIFVDSEYGRDVGSYDRVGQDVAELLGKILWLHNVDLTFCDVSNPAQLHQLAVCALDGHHWHWHSGDNIQLQCIVIT